MISLGPYKNELDHDRMAKYAGVKFYLQKCNSQDCHRDGEHSKHFWYDEVLVSDELLILSKRKGELDKKQAIPLRWYNFCFALDKVMDGLKTPIGMVQIINKAMDYAKVNCFDPAGDPNNMADKIGFSSYAKLMEMLTEKHSDKKYS